MDKIEQIKSGMNTGRVGEKTLQIPKKGSMGKVTISPTNKRYYSTGKIIDNNYLKKSGSIFNPGVMFKNKEVQTCLLICYLKLEI